MPLGGEMEGERLSYIAMASALIGFSMKLDGDKEGAVVFFADSLEKQIAAVEDKPMDEERMNFLFHSYHNYGVSLWEIHDVPGAINHYEEAIKLERFIPGGRWEIGRLDLANLYHQMGRRLEGLGDAEEAWVFHLKSAKMRSEVFDGRGRTSDDRYDLALAYETLVTLGKKVGHHAEAAAAGRLALALYQQLAVSGERNVAGNIANLTASAAGDSWAESGREESLGAAISTGSIWRYFSSRDGAEDGWAAPGFDDFAWREGRAQLGYGDGDETTEISYGPREDDKIMTAYFRHRFQVSESINETVANWNIGILCDDGAVIYLDGEEIGRINLPAGPLTHQTAALGPIHGSMEGNVKSLLLPEGRLEPGEHTIAVEVHQSNKGSTDLSFDLSLEQKPRVDAGRVLAAADQLGIPIPETLERR